MFSLVESPRGQARSLLIDRVIGAAAQNFMRGGNYFWLGVWAHRTASLRRRTMAAYCFVICRVQHAAARIATGLGAYARQA
ncbi:hypothetical protein BSR04_05200 [Serratia plymuthica]|nr:hypothetical protein BSR04_05200 [Serratia plymuthica]